jgi:hypothetical protein
MTAAVQASPRYGGLVYVQPANYTITNRVVISNKLGFTFESNWANFTNTSTADYAIEVIGSDWIHSQLDMVQGFNIYGYKEQNSGVHVQNSFGTIINWLNVSNAKYTVNLQNSGSSNDWTEKSDLDHINDINCTYGIAYNGGVSPSLSPSYLEQYTANIGPKEFGIYVNGSATITRNVWSGIQLWFDADNTTGVFFASGAVDAQSVIDGLHFESTDGITSPTHTYGWEAEGGVTLGVIVLGETSLPANTYFNYVFYPVNGVAGALSSPGVFCIQCNDLRVQTGQNIDRLSGVLGTASGWSTAPTNLAYATNGAFVGTGTGTNTALGSNSQGGYVVWDMGAVYSVEIRLTVTVGNTATGGQYAGFLVESATGSSCANGSGFLPVQTFGGVSGETWVVNGATTISWSAYSHARCILVYNYNIGSGSTTESLAIVNIQAIDLGVG